MDKQADSKKVINLELDEDIADWLKQLLDSYLTEYPWTDESLYMQAKLNAQLIIGKIIGARTIRRTLVVRKAKK
jgi:hypothetical protein